MGKVGGCLLKLLCRLLFQGSVAFRAHTERDKLRTVLTLRFFRRFIRTIENFRFFCEREKMKQNGSKERKMIFLFICTVTS